MLKYLRSKFKVSNFFNTFSSFKLTNVDILFFPKFKVINFKFFNYVIEFNPSI